MGGVLAVISSAEENERAAAAYVGLVDMVWIGAIEQANSGPEGFGWPSGEEWHYSNWAAGEPNGPTTFP